MGINTPEFARFARKREEWIECLNGEDRNSVRQQIIRMTWNVAAFRVVNEARRLAPTDADGGVRLNGMVNQLLDQSFVQSHMVAIRRLTDSSGLTGKRGVYSLVSLIADIEACRSLVTREHLLEAEGRNYDFDDVKSRQMADLRKRTEDGNRTIFTPPELDWRHDERRHEDIDRLCAVGAEARRRQDTLQPDILRHLRRRLIDACKDLETHVNKFIAHSATPESRAIVDADRTNLTFGHLWKTHRAVCQVASFVNVHVLGGASLHPLAMPQFDQFAFIERPLVTRTNVDVLRQAWKDFDRETHEWGNWGLDELENEITATRP